MVTCGGAMSGYCSIGATESATAPASTNSIEMTADRIGRSMKKCVNTGGRNPQSVRLVGAAALGPPACRGGRRLDAGHRRLHDLHRLPWDHLERALDHHPVAGMQAARDHDVLLLNVIADHHGAQLRRVVLLDHVNQVAVGALLHGK